jgi:Ca2+-binding RTX toxin-like protein
MLELQFNGQFTIGDDTIDSEYDYGISDLSLITDRDGDYILVGVVQGSAGVFAWDMSDLTMPEFTTTRSTNAEVGTGTGPSIVTLDQASGTGLLVTGLSEDGVRLSQTNGNGGTTSMRYADVLSQDWTTGVQLDNGLIALADAARSGFALFTKDAGDSLTLQSQVSDTNATHASAITAMAQMGDILLVGSANEYGISSYDTSTSTPTAITSFGSDDGIGIMAPTAISTVQSGDTNYAILASAGGSSGSLSVFSIGLDGRLIPTDHVMDTLDSRFGAVRDIAVAQWGNGALVVAGGGDDGLTVMALMSNGRLVHLASFEDTQTLALSGVTSLKLVIDGSNATFFAATQGDAGFSSMSIDLSNVGTWDISTGGLFFGTASDDILMTDTQATTLDGGAGHDIFVIAKEGDATHKVRNFDPDQDRLNLSDWSFLYDADDLDIDTIWNGVRITHRDETVIVTGIDNGTLDADEVRATIDLSLTRLPTIPNDTITGSSGNDTLIGNWSQDVIEGEGGNDHITGGAGDDMIFGGAGNDTAVLNGGAGFSIIDYDAASHTVTIQTADGIDRFDHVETFIIGGTTHTFDDLAPPPSSIFGTSRNDILIASDGGVTLVGREGDDSIHGGTGKDFIKGGTGNDRIFGNDGTDSILAGAGRDTLYGGAGDDVLNAGADNDLVVGGDGLDTYVASLNLGRMFIIDADISGVTLHSSIGRDVITEVEYFQFDDETVTLNDLITTTSRPTINGSNSIDRITDENGAGEIFSFDGDDAVRAGSGDDYVDAGAGADRVWGGTGRDQIYGGDGDDRLQGEAGNDMIHGGEGDDLLRGQANNDLMFGGQDDDVMYGGDGHDLMYGNSGTDFLSGGVRRDQLWGGSGDDDLRGGDDDDILYGGSGADVMRGGEHNDILYGGSEGDSILGGAGLDTIEGGSGNDILSGGGDRDTFVFNQNHGTDHITDYNMDRDNIILDAELVGAALSGQDVIDLFAEETTAGVTFSFEDGSVIVLDGVETLDGLAASISIL